MKFFSTVSIAASLLAVASAATVPATASTMKAIMDDFKKLSNLYSETVVALKSFPQSGAKGATNIHNKETAIEGLFSDVINNMQILPKPVSQENAVKIIDTYQSFTPAIIQSLNGITAKSPAFISLKAAPVLSNDMDDAANKCSIFASELLAMTPPAMLDDVNSMFDQLTAARENASAALASITA